MRLINADKFEVVGGNVPEKYDVESYLAGNREILEMIDAAPTINAVEVVRCYECVDGHDEYLRSVNTAIRFCDRFKRIVEFNHFCSYGKQRNISGG